MGQARTNEIPELTVADGVAGVAPYRAPRPRPHVDLRLDSNEGVAPDAGLLEVLCDAGAAVLREYPAAGELEKRLAERLGVEPARVLVTAGADEGLDRACRAFLAPGRDLIVPVPTFEMLERYARLAGAGVVTVPWPAGAYPRAAVLGAITPQTAAIAVVSPNNPTGAVASAADLEALSAAAPRALLIVDAAYTEFADEDLTPVALRLPNAIVVRSLSKAWGLAGLRVGYAAGPPRLIDALRAAGSPYSVSGPSIALAAAWLERASGEVRRFVARVRDDRRALSRLLRELGAEPLSSQANFVLARFRDSAWVGDGLAGLGIAVRALPGRSELDGLLRITCPGNAASFERLTAALRTVLAPQALLFDLDGVLADVSGSYRRAIIETAASFDVQIDAATVARAKAGSGASNDWELTRRLLGERGACVAAEEVRRRFELLYQGRPGAPGLRQAERLTVCPDPLQRLAARLPLAVVTARPRADAESFLNAAGVSRFFKTLVCMEDAPSKPSPAPVRLALERLGVTRAWMVGDTPDDIHAARAAGVVPVGVVAPGDDATETVAALVQAGAARVMNNLSELERLLP